MAVHYAQQDQTHSTTSEPNQNGRYFEGDILVIEMYFFNTDLTKSCSHGPT